MGRATSRRIAQALKDKKLAAGAAGVGALAASEESDAAFGGVKARAADHFMRSIAEKMKAEGRSREEIWQKTGWDLDNVDGQPRFEIDDSAMSMESSGLGWGATEDLNGGSASSQALGDYVRHPEMDVAYPSILGDGDQGQRMVGVLKPGLRGGSYGDGVITHGVNTDNGITFTPENRSTVGHEMQHALQDVEGFAQGGTTGAKAWLSQELRPALVDEYSRILDSMQAPLPYDEYLRQAWGGPSTPEAEASYKKYVSTMKRPLSSALERDAQITAGNNVYKRLAGEVEARNVEKRLNMSPQERRNTPPWETADIPESEQIVRHRGAIDPQLARVLGAGSAAGAGGALMMGPEIKDTLQAEGLMGALDMGWGALKNAGKFAWDAGANFGSALMDRENDVPTPDEYEPMTDTGRAVNSMAGGAFDALLNYKPAFRDQTIGDDVVDVIHGYQEDVRPWLEENIGPYATRLGEAGAGVLAAVGGGSKSRSTIRGAERKAFPGIYQSPEELLSQVNVAPESPNLGMLWDTSRAEMASMADRPGNMTAVIPGAPKNPRGSRAAERIMKPANTRRLLNALEATRGTPLEQGMKGWYVMDPMYQRILRLSGGDEEAAKRMYTRLNTYQGMASPGSDVLTEINRGSAANYLANQGRLDEFLRFGGQKERGGEDLQGILGHPYHSTAHGKPMSKYYEHGALMMESPKVPLYIQASGVPETGFQTDFPVGDAHWSRATGLADVRTNNDFGSSYSVPEAISTRDWWRDDVAGQAGYESVPGQAITWGLFSPQTGVDTPVGAPKLELIADEIARDAAERGISPYLLRDRYLMGEDYIRRR